MEQARRPQDETKSEPKPATIESEQRNVSQPEPLDEDLLKQIGGGTTEAPRGSW